MERDRLIETVIAREGGFVDHPADRGGPTNWGISEGVARANGFNGAMRDLSRTQAAAIYHARYWDAPGLDAIAAIAPKLAAEMFDTGVNMGPATAIGFVRRALNAFGGDAPLLAPPDPADRVDPMLIAALRCYLARRGPKGEAVLLRAAEALQGERYIALSERRPANKAFVYGWIARRIGNDAASF